MDSSLVVSHLIHPLLMAPSPRWRALRSHFLPWVEPKQCFLTSDSYQDLNILEALVYIFCYCFGLVFFQLIDVFKRLEVEWEKRGQRNMYKTGLN